MRRHLVLVVLVAVAASCDRGTSTTTEATVDEAAVPTAAGPEVCERLAEQAVDLVGDIVDALDGLDLDELTDTEAWGPDLVGLRERGMALDAEAAAAGCSPGAIQAAVRASIDEMEPDTALAELLVELLAPAG